MRRIGLSLSRLRIDRAPIHAADEWRCLKELAVGAIENIIIAVAIGLQRQLARLAFEGHVRKNDDLRGIIVVRIVRRVLEIPFQLAGIDIQRDNAIGIKIVAGPALAGPLRIGLARPVIDKLQLGIISAADPDRAAAWDMAAPAFQGRIATFGNGVPSPTIVASLFVIGLDEAAAIAGGAETIAGD